MFITKSMIIKTQSMTPYYVSLRIFTCGSPCGAPLTHFLPNLTQNKHEKKRIKTRDVVSSNRSDFGFYNKCHRTMS